jgi:hypothetical protein
MASTSSHVIVLALPATDLTPPLLCAPGWIMIRFDPIDWICSEMEAWEPCPIATMAITDPTPMIIPKTVRPDLTLFVERDQIVSLNKSPSIDLKTAISNLKF